MAIFNIFGLLFAIAGLAKCASTEAGLDIKPDSKIAWALDLPAIVADKLEKHDKLQEIKPINFIRTAIYDALRESYKKEVAQGKPGKIIKDVDVIISKDKIRGKEGDLDQGILAYNNVTSSTSESTVSSSTSSANSSAAHNRKKRQVIDVPIPTLLGHIPGGDDPSDLCERDEVLMDDGDCYELLDQGPCEDDFFVIMDPRTRKGFCGPRLCAPGKVFLFSDQLCHDSREEGLCPPGRMLFTSSFGTPLCGCPDGTYEEDDDLDDDVCEPILGHIPNCPAGEVFWFTDFRSPPACRPDPCKGLNLRRGPTDLPYVPALVDGKCYKVGSQPPFCKEEEFYSLSLEFLRGVCSNLDEAGYTILDDNEISSFSNTFGEFVVGSTATDSSSKDKPSSSKPSFPTPKPKSSKTKKTKIITPASTTLLGRPEIGAPVMKMSNFSAFSHFMPSPIIIGQSVVRANHHPDPSDNEVEDDDDDQKSSPMMMAILPTHMNAFSTPVITVPGSTTTFINSFVPMHHFGKRSSKTKDSENDTAEEEDSPVRRKPRHHRRKRSPLPFASPGNVFEPGLAVCRSGGRRDVNAKCRDTVLPSRYPPSRPTRDVSPVPPKPSCPGGGFWGLGRSCSGSSSGVSSIINRLGLG